MWRALEVPVVYLSLKFIHPHSQLLDLKAKFAVLLDERFVLLDIFVGRLCHFSRVELAFHHSSSRNTDSSQAFPARRRPHLLVDPVDVRP